MKKHTLRHYVLVCLKWYLEKIPLRDTKSIHGFLYEIQYIKIYIQEK